MGVRRQPVLNGPGDFTIGKRLTNLPALREVGFTANRRLLGVQRLSHNPIRAAEALTAVHDPIVTADGHRIARLRPGDRRAQAPLQALLIFRLLPGGFLNRDLRSLLTDLLGRGPGQQITAGQMTGNPLKPWRPGICGFRSCGLVDLRLASGNRTPAAPAAGVKAGPRARPHGPRP